MPVCWVKSLRYRKSITPATIWSIIVATKCVNLNRYWGETFTSAIWYASIVTIATMLYDVCGQHLVCLLFWLTVHKIQKQYQVRAFVHRWTMAFVHLWQIVRFECEWHHVDVCVCIRVSVCICILSTIFRSITNAWANWCCWYICKYPHIIGTDI